VFQEGSVLPGVLERCAWLPPDRAGPPSQRPRWLTKQEWALASRSGATPHRPGATRHRPRNSRECSGAIGSTSRGFAAFSRALATMPRDFGLARQDIEASSREFKTMPRGNGSTSRSFAAVSWDLATMPRDFGLSPRDIEASSREFKTMPQGNGSTSRDFAAKSRGAEAMSRGNGPISRDSGADPRVFQVTSRGDASESRDGERDYRSTEAISRGIEAMLREIEEMPGATRHCTGALRVRPLRQPRREPRSTRTSPVPASTGSVSVFFRRPQYTVFGIGPVYHVGGPGGEGLQARVVDGTPGGRSGRSTNLVKWAPTPGRSGVRPTGRPVQASVVAACVSRAYSDDMAFANGVTSQCCQTVLGRAHHVCHRPS
jgi:hypothetical protein